MNIHMMTGAPAQTLDLGNHIDPDSFDLDRVGFDKIGLDWFALGRPALGKIVWEPSEIGPFGRHNLENLLVRLAEPTEGFDRFAAIDLSLIHI